MDEHSYLAEFPTFWPVWLSRVAAAGGDAAGTYRDAVRQHASGLTGIDDPLFFTARQCGFVFPEGRTESPLTIAAARGDTEFVRAVVEAAAVAADIAAEPAAAPDRRGWRRPRFWQDRGAIWRLTLPAIVRAIEVPDGCLPESAHEVVRILSAFLRGDAYCVPRIAYLADSAASGESGILEECLRAGVVGLDEPLACRVVCRARRRSLVEAVVTSESFKPYPSSIFNGPRNCPLAAAARGECPAENLDAFLEYLPDGAEETMFSECFGVWHGTFRDDIGALRDIVARSGAARAFGAAPPLAPSRAERLSRMLAAAEARVEEVRSREFRDGIDSDSDSEAGTDDSDSEAGTDDSADDGGVGVDNFAVDAD